MQSVVELSLTEEQQKLKETIREFVDKEVKPDCRRRERMEDPAQRVPWDWITTLSRMGLRTMPVPEEYGGAGADTLTQCMAAEELAVGDAGLAETIDSVWRWVPVLVYMANEEQRRRYLPPFMADDTFLFAYGITEPTAGSDHFLPYNVPGYGPMLSAQRDANGDWLLNGSKIYVSNGGVAKLYIVHARTDFSKGGIEGLTAFFVEPGQPGFSIGRIEDKVGQRLMHNGELILDNCRVPAENVVGKEGDSVAFLQETLYPSVAPYAAVDLGIGRAAFEDALVYAKHRVQGGKPIIGHQAIKMMLADMLTQIRAARLLIWQVAWMADHPEHLDRAALFVAKLFTAEASFQVCKMAIEIFGGAGIMRDSPVEKYLRDAATFLHAPSQQITRLRIGDALEVKSLV